MPKQAIVHQAEIVREYGPLPGVEQVGGVTFDGERVWAAVGSHLQSIDPRTGEPGPRITVPADAGTAFDGKHFYQLTAGTIQKIDTRTGDVVSTIPSPGAGKDSGLAWAEGHLWVGQYRDRKIHCIDPRDGTIVRTIESDRFVTGVSWVDGELWHGALDNDASELRRIDPGSGEVLDRVEMPTGAFVSGLESDGGDTFFCGGGTSGKVRRVRRPRRAR